MEKAKVIFKKEKNPYTGKYEVFAVFPEFTATYGKIQAYTSEGWCEVSYEYYVYARTTKPNEYAEMFSELQKIFDGSDGEQPMELVIGKRISWKMKDKMWRESYEDYIHE